MNKNVLIDWNTKTEAEQIAFVQEDGFNIEYINDPSESVQMAAVNQNGYSIQCIKNPSEAVQLVAVKNNGWSIRHIKNPSEAVQLAAVNENGWVLEDITKPPPQLIKIALQRLALSGYEQRYRDLVKKVFANNALLMRKWLRYDETMRSG